MLSTQQLILEQTCLLSAQHWFSTIDHQGFLWRQWLVALDHERHDACRAFCCIFAAADCPPPLLPGVIHHLMGGILLADIDWWVPHFMS